MNIGRVVKNTGRFAAAVVTHTRLVKCCVIKGPAAAASLAGSLPALSTARSLSWMMPEMAKKVLLSMPADKVADRLKLMPAATVNSLLKNMTPEQSGPLIGRLDRDNMASFILQMSEEQAVERLVQVEPRAAGLILSNILPQKALILLSTKVDNRYVLMPALVHLKKKQFTAVLSLAEPELIGHALLHLPGSGKDLLSEISPLKAVKVILEVLMRLWAFPETDKDRYSKEAKVEAVRTALAGLSPEKRSAIFNASDQDGREIMKLYELN